MKVEVDSQKLPQQGMYWDAIYSTRRGRVSVAFTLTVSRCTLPASERCAVVVPEAGAAHPAAVREAKVLANEDLADLLRRQAWLRDCAGRGHRKLPQGTLASGLAA